MGLGVMGLLWAGPRTPGAGGVTRAGQGRAGKGREGKLIEFKKHSFNLKIKNLFLYALMFAFVENVKSKEQHELMAIIASLESRDFILSEFIIPINKEVRIFLCPRTFIASASPIILHCR
jgi:hypothetical protein